MLLVALGFGIVACNWAGAASGLEPVPVVRNSWRGAAPYAASTTLASTTDVIGNAVKVMRITCGWDRSVPAGRAIIIVKPALADVELT